MILLEEDLLQILDSIESNAPCIPSTLLYNEGWLLRLVLLQASRGIECIPLRWTEQARWFSEALLYSAFLPRFRGDPLAESLTHADAVIGQFNFGANTKNGLQLTPDARQFVVCEAKIFSPLSAGTKRAPTFDQAARNVACMAETLKRADVAPERFESLAFFVLAPESQIAAGLFRAAMDRNQLRRRIVGRVAMYASESCSGRMQTWLDEWAFPMLDRIDLRCIAWEEVIQRLTGSHAERGRGLQQFYAKCLKYNAFERKETARRSEGVKMQCTIE